MSANVETMFFTRERPWHGLGVGVEEAVKSEEALRLAGLDWRVEQQPIYTDGGVSVPGFRANVRTSDKHVLGVVTNRYRVIQNWEAFAFTDELLGAGVRYETAGSLAGGRRIWLLARLPGKYVLAGEKIEPYLVFSNSHDGSCAVRVAVTPIRVVCNNTLNLALKSARRTFGIIHAGDVRNKIRDARETLFMADLYMERLGEEIDRIQKISLTDDRIGEFVEQLLPLTEEATPQQSKNVIRMREDLLTRYHDAPDLKDLGKTAYRFINAVSDFATHAEPRRRTSNHRENLLARTIDGHPLIDRAYDMVRAA